MVVDPDSLVKGSRSTSSWQTQTNDGPGENPPHWGPFRVNGIIPVDWVILKQSLQVAQGPHDSRSPKSGTSGGPGPPISEWSEIGLYTPTRAHQHRLACLLLVI
jgi:hypothetical protein